MRALGVVFYSPGFDHWIVWATKSNFEIIASALTICLKQREASVLRRTALENDFTILVVRR